VLQKIQYIMLSLSGQYSFDLSTVRRWLALVIGMSMTCHNIHTSCVLSKTSICYRWLVILTCCLMLASFQQFNSLLLICALGKVNFLL